MRQHHKDTVKLPLQVLNGGADVFRCIAAEWKSVDPDSVNDKLRQQAKQVELDKAVSTRIFLHVNPLLCARVGLCRFVMALSMEWEPSLWGSKWEWRRMMQHAT